MGCFAAAVFLFFGGGLVGVGFGLLMGKQERFLGMRVLVTGASGFLGGHVVGYLQRQGVDVVAMVRAQSAVDRLQQLAPQVPLLHLDIKNESKEYIIDILKQQRISAVVHAAAYGVDYRQNIFAEAVQVNVLASEKLVQAAADAGIKRFVHVGTSYEYGASDKPIREDVALRPSGIYGVSKAAATLAVLSAAAGRQLPLVVFRPFGMYGPYEGAHKLVPLIQRSGREGKALALSPGGQLRDYVYVGDVAAAIAAVLKVAEFPTGEVFNLASGVGVSLQELGNAAMAAVGGAPELLQWGASPYRSDEVMVNIGCAEKVRLGLGWQATTSLAAGMALTAAAG